MKIHRFYIKDLVVTANSISITDKEQINQIKNVFRMENGDIFSVFGNGFEYKVEIKEISKNKIVCGILGDIKPIVRSKRVTLALAQIKKENLELIFEKCTEIGVTNFQILNTERSMKYGFNFERAEKILKEATEQSGFSSLPTISEKILDLEEFVENFPKKEDILVLDFGGENISQYIMNNNPDNWIVLIGPEGGFSDNEKEYFKSENLRVVSFGESTLRAETAAIVASGMVIL